MTAPTTLQARPEMVQGEQFVPGDGEPKPSLRHFKDRVIAIFPKSFDPAAKGYEKGTTQETFTVDIVLLDAAQFVYGDNIKTGTPPTRMLVGPVRINDCKISNGPICRDLLKLKPGQFLFGRLAYLQAASSSNMFFRVDPPPAGATEAFWAWWDANNGGLDAEGNSTAKPVDIEDPAVKAARVAKANAEAAMRDAQAQMATQTAAQGAPPQWAQPAVAPAAANPWGAAPAQAASVAAPAAANPWGAPAQAAAAPAVVSAAPVDSPPPGFEASWAFLTPEQKANVRTGLASAGQPAGI